MRQGLAGPPIRLAGRRAVLVLAQSRDDLFLVVPAPPHLSVSFRFTDSTSKYGSFRGQAIAPPDSRFLMWLSRSQDPRIALASTAFGIGCCARFPPRSEVDLPDRVIDRNWRCLLTGAMEFWN